MVCVQPERYPKGVNKKFHSRRVGPFKILKKLSSNASVLELLEDTEINNVLNIEDLASCLGHLDDLTEGTSTNSLPPFACSCKEVYDIIDH